MFVVIVLPSVVCGFEIYRRPGMLLMVHRTMNSQNCSCAEKSASSFHRFQLAALLADVKRISVEAHEWMVALSPAPEMLSVGLP